MFTVDDTTGDRKELGGAAAVAALWRSLGGCKAFDKGNQVHLGRVESCLVHNLEGEVGSVKGLPECCSGDAKLLPNVSLHFLCGEREGDVTRDEARHSREPSGGGTHSCGSGSDGKTRDASALSSELAKLAISRAKVVAPAESQRSQEGVQREVKREAVLYVRVCRKQT